MSGLGATLAKPVGPMPLGAWLLVGAGGLFIAYRSRQADDGSIEVRGDMLPQAGGLPSSGPTGSFDGAPVVLSPIFRIPAPVVNVPVNVTVPGAPAPTPQPKPTAPKPTPTVPPKTTVPKPAPKPAPKVITYTIRKGDTLWSIAARTLGAGIRWKTIYNQNKAAIEAAAKRHGHRSSTGPTGVGHWIFPGTVLRITK